MFEGWCHVLIMLAFSGYTSAPHIQILRIYCALSLTLSFFQTTKVEKTYSKQISVQHSWRDFRQQGFNWALVLAISLSLLLANSSAPQGILSSHWKSTSDPALLKSREALPFILIITKGVWHLIGVPSPGLTLDSGTKKYRLGKIQVVVTVILHCRTIPHLHNTYKSQKKTLMYLFWLLHTIVTV